MPASRPTSRKPAAPKKTQGSSIRIIGGQWRGRRLKVPDLPGLRPTGDRLRETLFNWLAPDLPGARCLDGFAGTGALGLEALSRGAESCGFVESNRVAADAIQNHLSTLSARGQLVRGSFFELSSQSPYDLIFLDPPFSQQLWQKAIRHLEQASLCRTGSIIYIETPRELALPRPLHWQLHREKTTGDICARLFIVDSANGDNQT